MLYTGLTQYILVFVKKEWKHTVWFLPLLVSLVEDLNGKRTKANGPKFWNDFWISVILSLYPNNWSLRLGQTPFFPFMKMSTKRQLVGGFGRKPPLTYIKLPRGMGTENCLLKLSLQPGFRMWAQFGLSGRLLRVRRWDCQSNEQPPVGYLLKYGLNGTILKGLELGSDCYIGSRFFF